MRRISRAEAAALRRDALRTWRYPWRELVIACTVLTGTGAWVGAEAEADLGSSGHAWIVALAGFVFGLAVWGVLRRSSVALLERSVVVSGLVGVRELALMEIAKISAYRDIRFEIDHGPAVTLRFFDSAASLEFIGLRTRGQWIADEIRAQAERCGNFAIGGPDERGRRDCWPRRAPWS